VSLDRLQRSGYDTLLVNGTLTFANQEFFVQGVPFKTLTIDGYGDEYLSNVQDAICIQSKVAARAHVWYQLGQPSTEYCRFYDPFVWLAQSTRHFVNYLLADDHNEDCITLRHFRRDFHGWLYYRYSAEPNFRQWLQQCNLRDFRSTVNANFSFLWKECHGIDSDGHLLKHAVWKEINPYNLNAIPRQLQQESQTIVTPLVYECFRRMYFAGHLEARNISKASTLKSVSQRKEDMGLTSWSSTATYGRDRLPTPTSPSKGLTASQISVGDVVCVAADDTGHWRADHGKWYASVQGVRPTANTTKLDLIWLYESFDTTLGAAYYPFANELFFSDNCACGRDAIDIDYVENRVDVAFFAPDPYTTKGLFVRQKFRTVYEDDTHDFVSLKRSDFVCQCPSNLSDFETCRQQYAIGDTVMYMARSSKHELESGQIVDFNLAERLVVLRRLQRQSAAVRPNELLLTEDIFEMHASAIIRKCHVRSYPWDALREGLPTPYDLNGSGDFFYTIEDDQNPGMFTPATSTSTISDLPGIIDGWDPDGPATRKLRGMGIFCGGGNYDRGLENGGAVEFDYAIDLAEHALHSYRANAGPGAQLFLGSVDDYLAQAMAGSHSQLIARPGDVEVLAAGRPYPGFSHANIMKLEPKALRNASLVASVVSYVDFYSPQYMLLENVVAMTEGMGPARNENVFAQVLATLVAMGYQVQQFLAEAWNYGSCQQRRRVFVQISAPGLEPLMAPPHTHSHPPHIASIASLGRSSNRRRFGIRRSEYTPFEHVSPLQALGDLPDIGDSLSQLCPAFPHHRTLRDPNNRDLSCMRTVPVFPRGSSLIGAIKSRSETSSAITGVPLHYYLNDLKGRRCRGSDRSTVFARVNPHGLVNTLLTEPDPRCGINGRFVHWDQPRTLTVMEARRVQGFLDHELIVGTPGQQMRIIGNSVDRKVALALGLSLRKSWLESKSIEALRALREADRTWAWHAIGKRHLSAPLQEKLVVRTVHTTVVEITETTLQYVAQRRARSAAGMVTAHA